MAYTDLRIINDSINNLNYNAVLLEFFGLNSFHNFHPTVREDCNFLIK